MIFPAIGSLLKKVDSRYTLVIVTSKRARQLVDGAPKLVNCGSVKPVTVAIHEIDEDKITYVRNKTSLK